MIKPKFYVINSIVLHAILSEVIDNFDFELVDTKNLSKDDFVNVKLSATLHGGGHHYCRVLNFNSVAFVFPHS